MYQFKDNQAFRNKDLGVVCYIPMHSSIQYTRAHFLCLASGNEEKASRLFDLCEWQHPETILDEWEKEGGNIP